MEFSFTTGKHTFLMPSEQIEELKGLAFTTFFYALPEFSEEHIELEAWKCRWATQLLGGSLYIFSNPALVSLVNADGVVLKRDDLPPGVVKEIIGDDKQIIGIAGNTEDALKFAAEGVDVLLLGPLRSVKTGFETGIEGLGIMMDLLRKNGVDLPVWAFGGISPDDVSLLHNMGVSGISVSSYILNSDEINLNAEKFIKP